MSEVCSGVVSARVATAPFINGAGIILKSCIENVYPETFGLLNEKGPGAGHARWRNAVEEINPLTHDAQDILYLTNPQQMPRLAG